MYLYVCLYICIDCFFCHLLHSNYTPPPPDLVSYPNNYAAEITRSIFYRSQALCIGVGGVFVFSWGYGDLLYVGSLYGAAWRLHGRDARNAQFVGGGGEFIGIMKVYGLTGKVITRILLRHYLEETFRNVQDRTLYRLGGDGEVVSFGDIFYIYPQPLFGQRRSLCGGVFNS